MGNHDGYDRSDYGTDAIFGTCDICGGLYVLGGDAHNGETGNHYECEDDGPEWDVTLSVTLTVTATNVADAKTKAWDYWEYFCPDLEVASVVRVVPDDGEVV